MERGGRNVGVFGNKPVIGKRKGENATRIGQGFPKMKLNIQYRIFLAMLVATGTVVAGMFLLMQWSIDRGFLRYVNTIETQRLEQMAGALEQAYGREGSWDFLRADPVRSLRYLAADLQGGEADPQMENSALRDERREWEERKPHPRAGRRFEARIVVLDGRKEPIHALGEGWEKVDLRPLSHRGRTVGYLGLQPREYLSDIHQLRFVEEQKLTLALVAAAVLLVVSAGLSFPLANRLVRPIRTLAGATHRLASGRYDTRVPVNSSDELGRLGRDFNALALALEKNEEARRRWVADISHELRTPLAVLRGEIEAIQDGIRQPTPEALASLHSEALHLGRLVDDLYQLALSDVGAMTYRKENLDPAQPLAGAVEAFRAEFERKGIRLDLRLSEGRGGIFIHGDPERLHQLFANLLDNSLKYTDSGGRLEVTLGAEGGGAVVRFSDSAPGVPEADLERLFERLYRVEGSRSRATGGAGLGLAICRNIVEAHEGKITARPSSTGGLTIEIELPLSGGKG